jgi:hypothetical protein
MSPAIQIQQNMRVVGSCGNYVGTVERVDGDEIRLTRNHPKAGWENHWVPLTWVEGVDDDVVRLDRESWQARREWRPAAVFAAV